MKRIIILISMAASALVSCSTASKIFTDSTNAEGERKIVTMKQSLSKKHGGELFLSFGVSLKGQDTLAAIIAIIDAQTGHGVFNSGNAMKFRLSDGEEITLVNIIDKKYRENQETHVTQQWESGYRVAYRYGARRVHVHPYRVDYLVPDVYTTTSSCSYAAYLITKQQLTDIVNKGVIKMRVEIEDRDIDLEEGNARYVSGILKDAITSVMERTNQKIEKKEF